MRGVEVRGPEFRMRFSVEPDRAHESKRFCDPIGEFLIAFGLRAVLDEAKHPAMDILEVGVAAIGEGAQKVEGRRGLAIGFQLPARVGLARLGSELDVIDNVAAVGRERHAVDRLKIGRAGLRELAGDPPDLHDRRGGGESHDHRHLQEHPKEIADVVGRMFAETLGAIAALQQECPAAGRFAEGALQLARFAGKNQRRIAGKLALGVGQRSAVGIDRRLCDRLQPPAIRGPTLVQHDPRNRRAAGQPLLEGHRLYTVRRLRPICRFSRAARILSKALGAEPSLGEGSQRALAPTKLSP